MISNCPGSQKFKKPQAENVKCPFCGADVEIWTDEVRATCPECKKIVARQGIQCCLDWCRYREKCLGKEAYKNYIKNKKK